VASEAREVGRVADIWRYPVKSMQGETLEASEVIETGLLGDRAFALLDIETGKVASAKSPRMWPNLLDFSVSFVEPPSVGKPLPAVRIETPDGETVSTADPDVDEILSLAVGRTVRLVSSNPPGGVFEQYVPPVEGADAEGSDFYREAPNDVFGTGSLYDAAPLHLFTTATVERLHQLYPEGRFDVRRFRPNVVIGTDDIEPQFVENDWLKSRLLIGEAGIRVTIPTMRCVMTTRPQRDLPQDLGILRTAAKHNRLDVLTLGTFPCVGVYCLVFRPGSIRVGDVVHLTASEAIDPAGEETG
jgi:uncharacterized protein YcbX